jgi:hypothetical protein
MTQQHRLEEKKGEEKKVADGPVEDIIELEEYAKAGKPAPKAKRYRIRVDKDRFVVGQSTLTGREILAFAQKTPQSHQLYQHIRGGQTRIVQPDETVDLTAPGVERFTTLKIENTEGALVQP